MKFPFTRFSLLPQTHACFSSFLTFVVKDPLHLHTTARVSDAEGPAGDQAFCGWGPIRGSNQTPVRLVMGSLQDLHGLPTADRQLITVAGGEVVDYHRQLAPTRQLSGKTRTRSQMNARYQTIRHIPLPI